MEAERDRVRGKGGRGKLWRTSGGETDVRKVTSKGKRYVVRYWRKERWFSEIGGDHSNSKDQSRLKGWPKARDRGTQNGCGGERGGVR